MMKSGMNTEIQQKICKMHGANFIEANEDLKIGVSLGVRDGILPVHGLRLLPERDTVGWYIWAGDFSDDPSFFVPLHVHHLDEWCQPVLKYLGFPPGWRFLIGFDYEDVWFDKSLLEESEG